MAFRDFYKNYKKEQPVKEATPEERFEDVVGVHISSLNAFVAWLILNSKIKSYIIDPRTDRPISIFGMTDNKKILHLVHSLPHIKELAKQFSEKWN